MSEDIYNRRVAGKVVTIKCRQCSTPIRVDGRQEGSGVNDSVPPETPEVDAPKAPVAQAAPPPAPPPFNDPLDPFSLPELDSSSAAPPPRAPMASLDDVVSSAPRILSVSPTATAPQMGRAAPPSPPRAGAPSSPEGAPVPPAPPVRRPEPPVRSSPEAAAGVPVDRPAPVAAPPLPVAAPAAAPLPAAAPTAPTATAPTPAAFQPLAGPSPAAAAVFAPMVAEVPERIPAPAPLPDLSSLDPATLRDPHAAFRRKSSKGLIGIVAGVVVVMGGVVYLSSGEEEPVKQTATPTDKPVIGVSLAPYRSDAQETLPVAPDAPKERPPTEPESTDKPAETGSTEDFAKRFKAASGRE